MGDRAVILFVDKKGARPDCPGLYLHWAGDLVPGLLKKTKEYMGDRKGDSSYSAARACGIAHQMIDGNLSLGLISPPERKVQWEDYSHGDQGVYIVECTDFEVKHLYYGHYDEALEPWRTIERLKPEHDYVEG